MPVDDRADLCHYRSRPQNQYLKRQKDVIILVQTNVNSDISDMYWICLMWIRWINIFCTRVQEWRWKGPTVERTPETAIAHLSLSYSLFCNSFTRDEWFPLKKWLNQKLCAEMIRSSFFAWFFSLYLQKAHVWIDVNDFAHVCVFATHCNSVLVVRIV